MSLTPGTVLDFWFDAPARRLWFSKDEAFDGEVRHRLEETLSRAVAGELGAWETEAEGALALVILLDQVPRNIYRGSPRSFACDALVRRLAQQSIERGFDQRLALDRRFFFYLPFEHGESADDQRRSVALFRSWVDRHDGPDREQAEQQFLYVLRHQEIIERFGRFPHRNAILGRASTQDEEQFLDEPMSSF